MNGFLAPREVLKSRARVTATVNDRGMAARSLQSSTMTQRSTGRPPQPDRDQLQRHQAERLRQLVAAVIPGNRFWSRKFTDAGCRPEDLQSPADLTRLPTTQKKELLEDQQATPPYGTNLTESVHRYSRLHQTSGTSSAPLRWLDTPTSWDWVTSCWRQIFEITETTAEDVVAFPFSFGPFLGFWAAFDAASRLGASACRRADSAARRVCK